jgi:hypothetical protein
MYLLRHIALQDFHAKWREFDDLATFMDLTPADRNLFWREQTADEFFHEWPVPMSHFCRDPYYVGPGVTIRDAIGDFMGDFFDAAANRQVFVFIGGLGAGKSFSASIGMEYGLYVLSTMRDPARWLSTFPGVQISSGSEIVLINASAAGANQSEKVVYAETFQRVMASPYFARHFEPYPDKQSELLFPHRIRMSPSTSKWQSVLGFNLFAYALDEAAFGIGGGGENAQTADSVAELFLNLDRRRRSRFGNLGFGGMFTSPGSEHSFVEVMAGEEGLDQSSVYVARVTTWDAKGEVVPGAQVFLLDADPDVMRILDSGLTFVADHRPAGGDLILQRANGEEVRARNVDPDAGPAIPAGPADAVNV